RGAKSAAHDNASSSTGVLVPLGTMGTKRWGDVLPSLVMSTAAPSSLASVSHNRALAEKLAPLTGRSVDEVAENLETAVSLPEAVKRGWFSEAEQRQLEGRASRADLEGLGYSPAEIDEILEEQKARR